MEVIVVVFILLAVLSWMIADAASRKGLSFQRYFLLSFLASPVVGGVAVVLAPDERLAKAARERKESVEREAAIKHRAELAAIRRSTDRRDVARELETLADLRGRGLLSDEEFQAQKRKVLMA